MSRRLYTYGGVTGNLRQLAREHGVPYGRVYERVRKGWTIEAALLTPEHPRGCHGERHANEAERALFIQALGEVPEAFSEIERAAVVAAYVERRSSKAAAAYLGLPPWKVKEAIERAQRWLRAWQATRRAA